MVLFRCGIKFNEVCRTMARKVATSIKLPAGVRRQRVACASGAIQLSIFDFIGINFYFKNKLEPEKALALASGEVIVLNDDIDQHNPST